MATSAQILANQKNAKLSTGPKTPEGKSAAARNATKHGLSGAFRVLDNEDQGEFDRLLASLRREFAPGTEHESFLVEQMAQSRWRLARIRRIETAVLDRMMENGIETDDLDRRIAAKFLLSGEQSLTALHRYASAAERSYYKAHKELMAARTPRLAAPAQNRERQRPVSLQNEPNPVAAATAAGSSGSGTTRHSHDSAGISGTPASADHPEGVILPAFCPTCAPASV